MPDQTLDQLAEETVPQDADLLYIVRSGLDRRIKRSNLLTGTAIASRTISTGSGLTGGGDLSADRTLSVNISGLIEDTNPDVNADYVMTHDGSANALRKVLLSRVGGGSSSVSSFSSIAISGQPSVIADGSADTLTLAQGSGISLAANSTTDTITISTTGLVPTTRTVDAGQGLTGGGDLTGNRSIALNITGQSEETAPDAQADYVIIQKSATGAMRKLKLALLSGGTAYTLPIATSTVLGGIKLGTGLSADVNGVVSASSTYTLPAATAGTLGGIRVGTGLAVNGSGILSNSNPTPYVLPPATVNTIGGIKPGQNVTISADGTLDFSGAGGGVSDGAYRPEAYGAIRGTGLSLTQRQTNTTALNACWAAAGDAQARIDMGGGTFEISGALNITRTGTIVTGDRCTIAQYLSAASVVTATNVALITIKGLRLTYGANQTAGDDPTTTETYAAALRLSGVTGSYFENITTSNAWVGIGISGSTGSSDNTFLNCRSSMLAGNSHGLVHKAGSGSAFIGCSVSGGGTTRAVAGGVYLAGMDQCHFTQLRIDFLQCRKPLVATTCQAVTFSGSIFDSLTLVPTAGYGGIAHGSTDSGLQFSGSIVSNTILNNTTQGITDAAVFVGELGANFLVTNLFLSATQKTGTVRFALLGHTSSAAARNVTGIFQQIRLDTRASNPHRLDDLCYATVDPASLSLDGPLLGFNNVYGAATGGFFALADASLTAYAAINGRYLRLATPLTANRTVTLSQYIDSTYANGAINAPRLVRGATVRVVRTSASTGSFALTVANHNAATLTTLAVDSAAEFMFDGTNWTLVPGSVSSGGSGGTFATQVEAEAGVSATTYMSPVRTKDAINAYASTNELGGSEGQVVGFNSTGLATAVKNTRVMLVTIVPEDTALATGTSVRKFMMPMGLKLTSVVGYTPTNGTSGTTFDVNMTGTTIFSAAPTIASSTASTTVSSFAIGTLTKNAIITIDIDAAGTGAKGLQIAFSGVEV